MQRCFILLLLMRGPCASAQGSPWTGDMHPSIGFPPACDIQRAQSCAPTYAQLEAAGKLWPCPDGNRSSATCSAGYQCVPANVPGYPLCNGLDSRAPC